MAIGARSSSRAKFRAGEFYLRAATPCGDGHSGRRGAWVGGQLDAAVDPKPTHLTADVGNLIRCLVGADYRQYLVQ
ncbi:Uncharacterised protein [Vibrio cholerae]|nr:Uncharacterised protein [Vibrio cholerae]CSI46241.1 Uncharacterised protein [Vibrio cholerae]